MDNILRKGKTECQNEMGRKMHEATSLLESVGRGKTKAGKRERNDNSRHKLCSQFYSELFYIRIDVYMLMY